MSERGESLRVVSMSKSVIYWIRINVSFENLMIWVVMIKYLKRQRIERKSPTKY